MILITTHYDGEYLPDSYTIHENIENDDDMYVKATEQFKKYLTRSHEEDDLEFEEDTYWIKFSENHKNYSKLCYGSDKINYDKFEDDDFELLEEINLDFIDHISDWNKLKTEKNIKIGTNDNFVEWQIESSTISVAANSEDLYPSTSYDFYEYFTITKSMLKT